MLHLAQVKQKDPAGKLMLQLLAQQKTEYAWAVLSDGDGHLWVDTDEYNEGALVLVDLSPTRQVQQLYDATPWILEMIEQFLALGITPAHLREEVQRAEQWRQSLTLQNQELGRRMWEVEARREQIQELEENLKQEKLAIDAITAQLKKASAHLKIDIPELNVVNGATEQVPPIVEKSLEEKKLGDRTSGQGG